MKILVTGSAGFIGSHLADALYDAGHEVYGCDDLSGSTIANVTEKQKFTKLNLTNRRETKLYIDSVQPEVLYHLAATAREGASQFSPIQMTETNLNAYLNTLVPCINTRKLKKVVLFSSMSVYGSQKPPFREDMKRQPDDVYAVAKMGMERNTEILSTVYDFKYTIIRPHNAFGIRQCLTDKFRNVIAIFMNRIMQGEPIYIYGDGEQLRAFSYINDSLNCYVKCLDAMQDGEIFNIGGTIALSVNELALLVIKAMDKPCWRIEHLADRPCEVKYAYCTSAKSEARLGYEEKVGVFDGIEIMAEWAKKIGPQPWSTEELEIYHEKTPMTWFPDFDSKNACRGESIS